MKRYIVNQSFIRMIYMPEARSILSTERKRLLTTHDRRADGEKMNTGGPSPLTHQRHVVGIAAKQSNVLFDPLKRRDLIHQPIIRDPRLGLRRHVGVEKTKHAQPVVHRYDHLVRVAG